MGGYGDSCSCSPSVTYGGVNGINSNNRVEKEIDEIDKRPRKK